MGKSIFDPNDRARLRGRLEGLTPHTRRRWGRMTPAQMQVHIGDQVRIALGTLTVKQKSSPLSLPPVRWLIIHSPLPWPHGAPTSPELVDPATGKWDADRKTLIELMEQVAARGEGGPWKPHPAFGKLSGHSWGVLMWRHIDHHLKQFGL